VGRVKVELLTVSDCPNRALALERLKDALTAAGVPDLQVAERVIDDPDEATAAGMHGSPTVLVDGHDPFAKPATEASVSCRLYRTDGGLAGAPSVADLIAAFTGSHG
jgi:hypothetical protein